AVASAASGAIWAVKVDGDAWIEGAARTRIVKDAVIPAGASIRTEANGSVVLLFQNGSTINIRPSSKFSIQEFSCDPFDPSKINYPSQRSEPGKSSRTKVSVQDGSIIANVRKLKGGSTFDIGTPLGTAGIRGTTVYAEVDMNNAENPVSFGVADGSATFQFNNGQTVNVGGNTAIGATPQGQAPGPPANAGQMLSTAQQVGQTMTMAVPPPPAPAGAAAGGAGTGGASAAAAAPATFGAQSTGASGAAGGPVAISSSGTVTILRDGAQADGASALNSRLAPGTIITTGEDGMASIEISPGSTIQLQPNTQITIGETRMDRAVSDAGDPVPQTAVTLAIAIVLDNLLGIACPGSGEASGHGNALDGGLDQLGRAVGVAFDRFEH
ncbi:MAG: FecR domain-containing protein, partial [Chthoniobacterales bacterium]